MYCYLPSTPMEPGLHRGRSPHDGYQRGAGLRLTDLRERVLVDPHYRDAVAASQGRAIIHEDHRINLFLIVKFYLAALGGGDIVEFGSYRGGTAIFLAWLARELHPGTRVHSLDTFEGMPPTDRTRDAHHEGDFADSDLDGFRARAAELGLDNLEISPGRFEEVAPRILEDGPGVALAHIDCDIYASVAFAYDAVKPHMVEGGYLVFDDATSPSCLGATEAVEDLVIRRDGRSCEQIWPQLVFRSFQSAPGQEAGAA